MAITRTLYELLKSLPVERGSSLLEIGEANWYGDTAPDFIDRPDLTDSARRFLAGERIDLFSVAKSFYAYWFDPSRIVAVDKDGTPAALRRDLNQPFYLGERFDVVINHGTAEHIFNVAQVFATMHDHCEVGGWMIHDAPFLGWIDHGFYCLQPTLFYDLAAANCYEVATVAVHEPKSQTIIRLNSRDDATGMAHQFPQNSLLFVAFRKRLDQPFRIPMQGYYSRGLSAAGVKAWEELR